MPVTSFQIKKNPTIRADAGFANSFAWIRATRPVSQEAVQAEAARGRNCVWPWLVCASHS